MMKIDYERLIEKTLKTDLELWASVDVKDIKACMKAACEQVLDEAAERAEVYRPENWYTDEEGEEFVEYGEPRVNKNSILSLKDEL